MVLYLWLFKVLWPYSAAANCNNCNLQWTFTDNVHCVVVIVCRNQYVCAEVCKMVVGNAL